MVDPLWGNAIVEEHVDDVLDGQVGCPTRIELGTMQGICWPLLGHKWQLGLRSVVFRDGLSIPSEQGDQEHELAAECVHDFPA